MTKLNCTTTLQFLLVLSIGIYFTGWNRRTLRKPRYVFLLSFYIIFYNFSVYFTRLCFIIVKAMVFKIHISICITIYLKRSPDETFHELAYFTLICIHDNILIFQYILRNMVVCTGDLSCNIMWTLQFYKSYQLKELIDLHPY